MKVEIKYALIISVSMFLWLCGEYAVGLHDRYVMFHPIVTNFAFIIPIVGFVLALREKKQTRYGGQMNYGQGIRTGLIITAVTALLSPLGIFLFLKYVNQQFFDAMIMMAKIRAMQGGVDIDQATAAAQTYFSLESYILQSFIGSLVLGSLLAVLIAYFIRTRQKTSIQSTGGNV